MGGRFDSSVMDRFTAHLDRRDFLLALGAGVPLLAQGCSDVESSEFRAGELELIAPLAESNTPIQVESALMSQTFIADEQGCSVPKSLAIAVGDQVRVRRSPDEYALYTVEQKRKQDNPNSVRMGLDARLRLGTANEFAGTLVVPVVAQGLTDAQAQAASEFVERLVDDGSNTGLIVLAPHGGTIEFNTDLQAEAMTAALDCSSWICKGWKAGGGSFERWHISSNKLSPHSFPGLAQIANRGFAYAVSFHGMATGGIVIGGTAPVELRQLIRSAILDALDDPAVSVTLPSPFDSFDGDLPTNVVNWLTLGGSGGIQIEQDRDVRADYWQEVVAAVIGVFSQLI